MKPKLPVSPRVKSQLTASWGRSVVRFMRSITIQTSPTIRAERSPSGTSLILQSPSLAARRLHPFQITACGRSAVTVRFGQVNNTTPTIGGIALDASPPPVLEVSSGVVYLDVRLGARRNVCHVSVESSRALPKSRRRRVYVSIGRVRVDRDGTVRVGQELKTSLSFDHMSTSCPRFRPI